MNNKRLMTLAQYKQVLNTTLDILIKEHGHDIPVVMFDEQRKQYASEPLLNFGRDDIQYYLLAPKSDHTDAGAHDQIPVICLGR